MAASQAHLHNSSQLISTTRSWYPESSAVCAWLLTLDLKGTCESSRGQLLIYEPLSSGLCQEATLPASTALGLSGKEQGKNPEGCQRENASRSPSSYLIPQLPQGGKRGQRALAPVCSPYLSSVLLETGLSRSCQAYLNDTIEKRTSTWFLSSPLTIRCWIIPQWP